MEIEYKKNGILTAGTFIHLNEIVKRCTEEKIKEEKLLLLKMQWSERRGFEGILEKIVLPIEKIEIIKKHILGKTIYFGEIAGKHSEIYGHLDENEIEIIEDQKEVLDFLINNPSGHDYNHSFLYTFSDYASDGGYDDVSDDDVKEFETAFD